MSIKSQLTSAMKEAMKAKEKARLGAIRLILAEVKRIEVDERIEIEDDRLIAIMDKMVKQRRDSAKQYTEAGRPELAEQENFEIEVISSFLPAPLTEEEIQTLISDAITKTGAESMRDMGKVMGMLKPQIQGRADAGEVSKLIKARLG